MILPFQDLILGKIDLTHLKPRLTAQRNFALTKITNPNTPLYCLDNYDIVHSNLYKLLSIIDN
jgi:hypothetical protein